MSNVLDRDIDDKAATLAATALSQLSEALAKGDSEALKAYLAFLSRFHKYSFRNQLLVLVQKPEATQVAGFSTWKSMGRYVKRGEKGIAIFVPVTQRRRKAKEEANEADSKSDKPEETMLVETLVGFTTGYVFDVSQTEGEPLPDLPQPSGNPQQHLQKLRGLTLSKGIGLTYSRSLDGAKGMSIGGAVYVLEGLSPAEDFLVLCHELAHEMLHRGQRRSQTDLRIRELEAESVAYAVGTAIGLESKGSFDYIRLYKGDQRMLAESLEHVQRIASEIIREIL